MFYEGGERIDFIRDYLLAVFAAAIICAIVIRLVGDKGTQGAITRLVAGLFLALTVIHPVASVDLTGMTVWSADYSQLAAEAASEGETQMRKALASGIKMRSEAYILDKARALNVELEVEVTLSDDEIPVPMDVKLSGKVSPYAKAKLQSIITEDLGIEKEHQAWT